LLATSPKSNSAYLALDRANQAIEQGKGGNVPAHLQSPLFKGYRYPHDYPDHYVPQEYLPYDLRGARFYEPAQNKQESAAAAYWESVKARATSKK
jgi:putative ATPase